GLNGLVERDLNLEVAKAAEVELGRRGIGVALTRTADYATILAARAEFADAIRAEALVSIHHNAPMAAPSGVPGTEIFVQSTSRQSRRLGGVLYERLFEGLSVFDDVDWQAAEDAGVVEVLNTRGSDAYGMVRRPTTPSVLLEIGYLANPSEEALMATSEYVEVAAFAIADGVEDYLDTGALGGGYVAEPRVFDPAAAPGASLCEDPPLE
ncbi:MAG: N-acetylmuramoyl-L-alanine amidase family protein, partial [Acidimicrobiales bacterium]